MAQIYTFLLNLTISEIPFRINNVIGNLIHRQSTPSSNVIADAESSGFLEKIYPENNMLETKETPMLVSTNQPNTSSSSVNLGISIESGQHDLVGIPGNTNVIEPANNETIQSVASNFTESILTKTSDNITDQKSAEKHFETVTADENALLDRSETYNPNVIPPVKDGDSNRTVQYESKHNNISFNASINSVDKSTENAESSVVPGNTREIASPESIDLSIITPDKDSISVSSSVIPDSVETAHSNVFLFPKNQSTSQNDGDNSSTRVGDNLFESERNLYVNDIQNSTQFANKNTDGVPLVTPGTIDPIIKLDNPTIKSDNPTINAAPAHVDATATGTPVSSRSTSRATSPVTVVTPPTLNTTANTDDVSPINHIGLSGTIYFYVNQETSTPQLVSGEINHTFDVKDTHNNSCPPNPTIQITHEINGKSTTSPFNAKVNIENDKFCINGNMYTITNGRQITVGNITYIPPRPDTTFTIRETDKQFVNKYFEYSGKIYVDDWSSKIHWHTYYNPENYKVSSLDSTKENDTLGVFNIGNWALYKRKINMYIGNVTVMGNIHISPPPFNIDLKKTSVSGGSGNLSAESNTVDNGLNTNNLLQQTNFYINDDDDPSKTPQKKWDDITAKSIGNQQPSQSASSLPNEHIHNWVEHTNSAKLIPLQDNISNTPPTKSRPTSSTNPSKSRLASSITQKPNIEDSKVAPASQSGLNSRRSSRSSTDPPSKITSHPLKSKELIDIETEYTKWKKESRDVARFPYREYYNNKEKSTESKGILTEDLIDRILFYRSLENKPDLQNKFIDNIHHFLDDVFLDKIAPLVETILNAQTIQEDSSQSKEDIPEELIDLGESFENEKNETNEYTLLRQTNPPHSDKPIASNLLLPAITRVRAARKELLNKAVKLLLEQNKSKDSSIISDNTSKKKQAKNPKYKQYKGIYQPPDKKTSNGSQYKIQISGTLHTLVGEGKIHHTFYLVKSPQTNGAETYTHTLTKIELDKTDAFSKYIDAKFHISGSWVFVPKNITGKQDVPDFPKQVYFGKHDIDLPFMYKTPTDQNEQPASIEIKQIHIYKIVDNTDELLISGSIDLFDSAKPTIHPQKKIIHFDPLVYNFNSKMQINVENKGKNIVQFNGYVVNNEGTHRIFSNKTATRRSDRPSTAPANRYSGGRRTRRFRKNLKT